MLAALRAIERPDDELAVFATLRGSLFAVGDEALLEYRHTHGKFRITSYNVCYTKLLRLTLVQTDSELSEVIMRAFILRRVELIAHGFGGPRCLR